MSCSQSSSKLLQHETTLLYVSSLPIVCFALCTVLESFSLRPLWSILWGELQNRVANIKKKSLHSDSQRGHDSNHCNQPVAMTYSEHVPISPNEKMQSRKLKLFSHHSQVFIDHIKEGVKLHESKSWVLEKQPTPPKGGRYKKSHMDWKWG